MCSAGTFATGRADGGCVWEQTPPLSPQPLRILNAPLVRGAQIGTLFEPYCSNLY